VYQEYRATTQFRGFHDHLADVVLVGAKATKEETFATTAVDDLLARR
jgi:hypothetical protein